MDKIFLTVLNMSITATFVLAVVLLLRFLFQRLNAQKWMVCALWIAVFFRLLCPVTITSEYSVLQYLPQKHIQSENGQQMQYISDDWYVRQLSEKPDVTEAEEKIVLSETQTEEVLLAQNTAMEWPSKVITWIPVIWIFGVMVFAGYSSYQWYMLRRRLNTATLVRNNIYESDQIHAPFVFGLWKPRIYVPIELDRQAAQYILLHELCHIQRGDLWWKALAQLAVMLHWFNPFVHIAYHLFSQDLEQACDEKVIMQMGEGHKTDYCRTLLAMSTTPRQLFMPLAFGESKTKQRVKNILHYGKPAVKAGAVFALIAVMVVGSCITNPMQEGSWGSQWGESMTDSLLEQTYWLDQSETMTAVYAMLYPDDPLDVKMDVLFQESHGRDYRTGEFTVYSGLHKAEDSEAIDQILFSYTELLSFLYQIDDYGAGIHYQNHGFSKSAERSPAALTKEQRMAYPQTKDGLQQLLNDMGFSAEVDVVDALWQIAQDVDQQEQQMRQMQQVFSEYDLQVESAFWYTAEKNTVYVRLDESEKLYAVDRSEEDYLKTALLIFASCPHIDHLELAFVGRPYATSESSSSYATNYWLQYHRDDLEQQYGFLQIQDNMALEEQLKGLLQKVQPVEHYNTQLPEMTFTEQLKRIEFDPIVPHEKNTTYNRLLFSLLPEQFPEEDGCYLKMNLIIAGAEGIPPRLVDGDSSMWIYGEKAQWKETAEPIVQWKTQETNMALVRVEGEYQIVVSRWDKELIDALEMLGGTLMEDQSSLWTVVYGGKLIFQQLLPHNVLFDLPMES